MKRIICFITCLMITALLSGCAKKVSVTYGDYYLSNDENSNSLIRLSEDGVYFENIDFDAQMQQAAKLRAITEKMSLHNEGVEMTTEEFKETQKKYYDELDFETMYQNQEVPYETEKDEESGILYFYVLDEEERVHIMFYFDEKQGWDTMYFGDDIYKVKKEDN